MQPKLEAIAKYAGLATVVVEWSALLLYYLKMPLYFGSQYPISYFATLPETKWVFTTCYVLAAICFWIFARHHLTKHYTVPLKVFGISLLLFACTGLYPFDFADGWSVGVHSVLAGTSGTLFLVGMYLLAKKANDRILYRVTVASVILSFILSMVFMVLPKTSVLIFTFEAGSWLVLQIWTIWISFHTNKKINYLILLKAR